VDQFVPSSWLNPPAKLMRMLSLSMSYLKIKFRARDNNVEVIPDVRPIDYDRKQFPVDKTELDCVGIEVSHLPTSTVCVTLSNTSEKL
jgi:hypothetical protein